MQKLLLIGLAGLAGTLARYGLSDVIAKRFALTFPLGTVVVNLAGCLLAGFLFHILQERLALNDVAQAALMIGFLGGFTTFSAFGLQTFIMIRNGDIGFALLNVLMSNLVGVLMVWVGYSAAKLSSA